MNKIVASCRQAVSDVEAGSTVLVGGFGGSGGPANLVDALVASATGDLTIVGNGRSEWMPFLEQGLARKVIAGFTGHPHRPEVTALVEKLIAAGMLEVQTVPHGILEERIRAGGFGIAGFFSPVGVGTPLASGKESRTFDDREYVLERALHADFALVKGWRADRWGNVVTRLGAGNRNVTMAMGARITVVEVDEIVELGEIDPNRVDIPGCFVQRVVQAPTVANWTARS